MTKLYFALAAVLLSTVGAHEGHGPPSPRILQAMENVKASCDHDAATLCRMPSDFLSSRRDPVADFMMSPLMPPPLIIDSNFLDDMLNSALRMSAEQPMGMTWTVIYDSRWDEPHEAGNGEFVELANNVITTPEAQVTPDVVLDSMVSSLAEKEKETTDSWDPVDFANRMGNLGNLLLQSQDLPEEKRRLARRLSETNPDHFKRPRLPLPYSCPKSRCLMDAYEQGVVSDVCSDALKAAEQVQQQEHVVDPRVRYLHTILFCVLVSLVPLFVILYTFVHHNNHRMEVMEHRRLTERILQAVYSNPQLKASVEFQLQEHVGAVPPLPLHVLARMGGAKLPMCFIFCRVCLMVALLVTFFSPFLGLLLVATILTGRCLMKTFLSCKPPVRSCSCCCCSLSTEDVKNGTVSAKQACCTCCNGLGVCGPLCMSCCGTNPEEGCGCCEGDCDCCNPVPECTCHCCGLTNWNAKNGIVTKEQTCCNQCNGTGVCGTNADCVDNTRCCNEKKTIKIASKVFVFQGVPVQMV